MTDIAESLNTMTVSLHGRVVDIQADVEQLLESASRQDAPQELIDELGLLKQKIGTSFKI